MIRPRTRPAQANAPRTTRTSGSFWLRPEHARLARSVVGEVELLGEFSNRVADACCVRWAELVVPARRTLLGGRVYVLLARDQPLCSLQPGEHGVKSAGGQPGRLHQIQAVLRRLGIVQEHLEYPGDRRGHPWSRRHEAT